MTFKIQISIIVFVATISFGGCVSNLESPVSTPMPPTQTREFATATVQRSTRTTKFALESVSEITETADLIAEPTPTPPVPLIEEANHNTKMCTSSPKIFDVMGTLDIYAFAHLRFQGDDTLFFDGWAPRPAPENALSTSSSSETDSSSLGGFSSARVLFQAGKIALDSGEISSQTLNVTPVLNIPCEQDCPLDILSQSPDGQWQLVQISDYPKSKQGVWLISQKEMVHLIPYVPSSSNWQWSNDNSIFWYVYSPGERGANSVIVYFEDALIINHSEQGQNNPLDATYYRLSFSPVAKTILSIANPFEIGNDTDEIYMLNVNNPDIQSSINISNVKTATWNEATQSYVLMVTTDEGTNFVNLDGETIIHVPGISIPPLIFALSQSGKYLAVGYGAVDGVRVFECTE